MYKSHKNTILIIVVLAVLSLLTLSLASCMDSAMRIVIAVDTPQDNATVNSSPITVSGSISKNATIKVNGVALPRGDKFSTSVALNPGTNTIDIVTISDNPPEEVSKQITVTYTPK